ncbi:DUF3455 domain-containing protein [Aquincola sp. S2]|uniref:DUF3455 domain-containing protein n=1 Tax=Pseudaquabacterium terrae TaxID=2732868 RepID=A0ABX2ENN8_9BURK|nr:DUF3455 domain-containing protein [Aquabacterium terrae]NRF70151.1 DUF3455 domain-containing protein [Aquabacterium terrae]
MIRLAPLSLTLAAAVLAACAQAPSKPSAAAPAAVPAALQPGAGQALVATIGANGVQIYECRADKDKPGAAAWVFVAPEADLLDAQGKTIGKHYAGPSWESLDGSKLVGTVKARAAAPQAGNIPWLLLTTRSVGPAGSFAKTNSIQRINTEGGEAPPAAGCTTAAIGKVERVGYTADYLLFADK